MSDEYYRRMIVSHEAWPGLYGGKNPEIGIGYDHRDGGTAGEFTVRWHNLGDRRRLVPRLEVFQDAWAVLLKHFGDLLELLAEVGEDCPQPAELATRLRELGLTDETERYRREAGPPICVACGQELSPNDAKSSADHPVARPPAAERPAPSGAAPTT